MPINIRDGAVALEFTSGSTIDFDVPVIVQSVQGGAHTIGSRVLVQIRVMMACELRVSYAVNGPDGALVFNDRGTVDRLVQYTDFRGVFAAIGTNMRLSITNIDDASGNADVFTTIL